MPKERRDRSLSLDRSRLSPFPCSSSCSVQSMPKDPLEDEKNIKEWEDARCPVCMEHPHNGILLICSSHDKGCRPFMCDTSYRHSNCFDQFRKSSSEASMEAQSIPENIPEDVPNLISSTTAIPEASNSENENFLEEELTSENPEKSKLACPLCRGLIAGWTVVKSARHYMNAKSRSCASETCDFVGTYTDLRKHARLVHPLVRPADADPERQSNWRRMETQRNLADLLSSLQSSIGGEDGSEDSTSTIDEGGWLTVYILVRFIQPPSGSTPRRSSRTSSAYARARVPVRRSSGLLFGESYDEEQPDENEEASNGGQSSSRRRNVRRRLNNNNNPGNQ